MADPIQTGREKVYSTLRKTASRYHFCPLDEGLNGKRMHKNLLCCITQRRKMATATHLFSPIVFQFT